MALTQLSRRFAVALLFLGLSLFISGKQRGARHDGGWRNTPCGTFPIGESTLLQSLCKEQGNVIFQMRASLLQHWVHLLCFPSLLPSPFSDSPAAKQDVAPSTLLHPVPPLLAFLGKSMCQLRAEIQESQN